MQWRQSDLRMIIWTALYSISNNNWVQKYFSKLNKFKLSSGEINREIFLFVPEPKTFLLISTQISTDEEIFFKLNGSLQVLSFYSKVFSKI